MKIMIEGNKAVCITAQGPTTVEARLYVNARDGFENADPTSVTWRGKYYSSAERWAAKQLAKWGHR
jgi:hypothetical protein